MAFLAWREPSNLKYSLIEFIKSKLAIDSLDIQVVADRSRKESWTLPLIQITFASRLDPRLYLGNNLRDKQPLIICDIRCDENWIPEDIADWLIETLKDGFPYYEFTKDGDNPTKVQNGNVSVDFLTNQDASQGEDAHLFDKYRWRISMKCWTSNK